MNDIAKIDWDLAYSNVLAVTNSADYPPLWQQKSLKFREKALSEGRLNSDIAYGNLPRNKYDLFYPIAERDQQNKGLVVYVHGGYWMKLDKSCSSYLAAGALAHGFAVAVISYTLCPDVWIGDIVNEAARAIEHAGAKIDGPIYLTGHSAGGQIVSRMSTKTSPLDAKIMQRIKHTVSISGLSDLRPLIKTEMNDVLRLDDQQAYAQSPALLEPVKDIKLTAWVGGAELPEFIRQSALHANIWSGFDCETSFVKEADKHHLNIIDGLSDPEHILTKTLLEIA
ncbi:alpha/beta hydrolase [Paenochrobactrum pullorum]|uniref:alpha/beta hydrolase n=1 Tax=Paenochrobactrum pullorum TaxID=1324351 RepID=UPI0035BC7682